MTQTPYAVELENITVRFPGVLANDQVNFTLKPGEIHALLGENGAGKSTLMNVLSGLYKQTEGMIKIQGEPVSFNSPKEAIAQGIGMVHQHFMLVPTQTVTENILLGLDIPRFFLRLPHYDDKVRQLQDQFGLHVDPRSKIWQLSVGEQQRVEILKMLYRRANILIMDEPTAVLAPQEIEELMSTMRSMAAQGKSIIFISHKLDEVSTVADRVTILRRGRVTAEGVETASMSKADLAKLMVGREVVFNVQKSVQQAGDVILKLDQIHTENDKGLSALRGVSLEIRQGEILGIAGVAGNGQSELAQVITGLRPCRGQIHLNGQDVSNAPPIQTITAGVAHVPEDRHHVGTAPNLSMTDNTMMKTYTQAPIGNGWTINFRRARSHAQNLKDQYNILTPTVDTPVRQLSGGNLQKVILAREISTEPKLLVAVQPTRGLDVGAIEAVQKQLLAQREAGAAILLISEELDELLALSDRLAILFEGQIMGTVSAEEADVTEIGLMMTGSQGPQRNRGPRFH